MYMTVNAYGKGNDRKEPSKEVNTSKTGTHIVGNARGSRVTPDKFRHDKYRAPVELHNNKL